jgi:hypothetical protein
LRTDGELLEEIEMKTVDEIFAAAEKLRPDELLRLLKKLDRLEQRIWNVELNRVSAKLKKANITDEDINQMVMRRRYESRR